MVTLAFVLMLPFYAIFQNSNFDDWPIFFRTRAIQFQWDLHHEDQYRNYNAIGDLEQLILNSGLGYNLSENINILMGYGYTLSKNYADETNDKAQTSEHRIYQQFISKQKNQGFSHQHRYRFEQRFLEDDFK